jgi:anti-anti-sigma factor
MTDLATLEVERDGQTVYAALAGEIDPSNARDLGSRLTEAVPNDALAVILDLAEIDFIDSSGIQLIFELAERLEARQQRLAVVVPEGAPAQRVIEIVALDATAPVAPTREDALERLGRT